MTFTIYSNNNPIQYDPEIMGLVNNLNKAKDSNEIRQNFEKLVEKIKAIQKPDGFQSEVDKVGSKMPSYSFVKSWNAEKTSSMIPSFIDEMVRTIRDPGIKIQLAERLGLRRASRDVVCDYAQGTLPTKTVREAATLLPTDRSNIGDKACACICVKAAETFLDKKFPQTEEEMYELMDKGIETYNERGFKGTIFLSEALERSTLTQKALVVVPEAKLDRVDADYYNNVIKANPIEVPLFGLVESDFPFFLKELEKIFTQSGQKACAFITSHDATIVVGFSAVGKPVLFDSHGTKYNDVDKGATLRNFESIEDLNSYLKKLFKNEGQFEMTMVKATPKFTPSQLAAARSVWDIMKNEGEGRERNAKIHIANVVSNSNPDMVDAIVKKLKEEESTNEKSKAS